MSIRKRKSKKAKNGYTYQVYFYYVDSFGIKRYYSKSGFKSKPEAQAHEIEKKSELKNTGTILKASTKTLNEVYDEFIAAEGSRYSHNTLVTLGSKYKNYVRDTVGHARITYFSDYSFLQNFFNSLSGYSRNINIKTRRVVELTCQYAIKCGYISSCPINLVNLNYELKPKKEREPVPFDVFQHAFLDLEDCYAIPLAIGYYTGMRLAEALAVTREDIDFENQTININKQLIYIEMATSDYHFEYKLKTPTSRSVVPMTAALSDILKDYMERSDEFILCQKNGGFYNVYGFMNKLKKNYGFTFHQLRHTFASNIVAAGVDMKTAQELMRHSNFNTTMSVYAHADIQAKKEAVDDVFKTKNVKNMSKSKNELS